MFLSSSLLLLYSCVFPGARTLVAVFADEFARIPAAPVAARLLLVLLVPIVLLAITGWGHVPWRGDVTVAQRITLAIYGTPQAGLALLPLGLFTIALGVQPHPNFSGRWHPADQTTATQMLVVTQNESGLTATLTDGATTETVRFAFAGPSVQDVVHPNVTVTSTATWKESTLEATTTFKATESGNVMSVRTERWSLDANGRLVIETSTVRGNAPARVSRSVYLRR